MGLYVENMDYYTGGEFGKIRGMDPIKKNSVYPIVSFKLLPGISPRRRISVAPLALALPVPAQTREHIVKVEIAKFAWFNCSTYSTYDSRTQASAYAPGLILTTKSLRQVGVEFYVTNGEYLEDIIYNIDAHKECTEEVTLQTVRKLEENLNTRHACRVCVLPIHPYLSQTKVGLSVLLSGWGIYALTAGHASPSRVLKNSIKNMQKYVERNGFDAVSSVCFEAFSECAIAAALGIYTINYTSFREEYRKFARSFHTSRAEIILRLVQSDYTDAEMWRLCKLLSHCFLIAGGHNESTEQEAGVEYIRMLFGAIGMHKSSRYCKEIRNLVKGEKS